MANAKVGGTRLVNFVAANQTFTSNDTLANLTDLTFAMEASKTYRIYAYIQVGQAGTAAGLKIAITGPASPTNIMCTVQGFYTASGPTLTYALNSLLTSYTTINSIPFTAISNNNLLKLEAVIENGVNAGTFAIQAAQQTSDSGATTIFRGSYIEVTRF